MPELPDLVHVEAGLRSAIGGMRIVGARTGDPTVLRLMLAEPFPDLLIGRTVEAIDRRGHFMRFGLSGDLVLVINAMLVGRYKLGPAEAGKKDPRALGLALVLDGGIELQYVDEKRMGKVYVARANDEAQIPVYGKLGLDVMAPSFTRAAFGKAIAKRRDQVRAFLMDKGALASIGNAYADEILFAAGLHPKTFCSKLEPAAVDALYAAIGKVLAEAIDEIRRRGEAIDVKVRDFLKVRGRDGKPCLVCGTTIRAVRVGDGDACFCPTCQPETRKLFINWSLGPSKGPKRPAMGSGEQSSPSPDAIGLGASKGAKRPAMGSGEQSSPSPDAIGGAAAQGEGGKKERRTAFSKRFLAPKR
jgi:formamidopyrimidine-DNA glycosylase